jgi:hypothetical protein
MPGGRPTKYSTDLCKTVEKLCALGAVDMEIADFLEIDIVTFYRWKNEHEEFCNAIKVAKENADARVERSLFERATGYSREEIDIRVADGCVIQTPIRKHYPPDTTAMIFWLKNRKRKEWPDRHDVAHQNPDGTALTLFQEIAGASFAPKPPAD